MLMRDYEIILDHLAAMGRHIFEIRVLFAGSPNSECSSNIPKMQKQPSH